MYTFFHVNIIIKEAIYSLNSTEELIGWKMADIILNHKF